MTDQTAAAGKAPAAAYASLAGKRIVITRARAQAGTLAEKLRAFGAEPILLPMIEIAPLDDNGDNGPLQAALAQLAHYQWLVFTSANAVAVFFGKLSGQLPPDLRLGAVGPSTARALAQRGLHTAVIPEEYVAEALAAALGDVSGQRILLPQAELAREALAAELRQRGAIVDALAVYRTLPAALDQAGLAELRRGVDAITFTSGSAARNFARAAEREALALGGACLACIGPVTAAEARAAGLAVDVVAKEYTLDGLLRALQEHF